MNFNSLVYDNTPKTVVVNRLVGICHARENCTRNRAVKITSANFTSTSALFLLSFRNVAAKVLWFRIINTVTLRVLPIVEFTIVNDRFCRQFK